MPNPNLIPLSLYIHIPWCVKKCPYCDFNSHESRTPIDFVGYVDALLDDLKTQLSFVQGRKIATIFIGAGRHRYCRLRNIGSFLRASMLS